MAFRGLVGKQKKTAGGRRFVRSKSFGSDLFLSTAECA